MLFSFKCHCLDSCGRARHCCNLKWSQTTDYWLEMFCCIESSFSRWIHLIVCLYCGVSSTLLQSCKAMAAVFPISAVGKIPCDEAEIPYRCVCVLYITCVAWALSSSSFPKVGLSQTFHQPITKLVMVKVVWAQLMGIGKYGKNHVTLLRALGDLGTLPLLG